VVESYVLVFSTSDLFLVCFLVHIKLLLFFSCASPSIFCAVLLRPFLLFMWEHTI
jgi:hypothetical protein